MSKVVTKELEQALALSEDLKEELKKLGITEEEFRKLKTVMGKCLSEKVAELLAENVPKDFTKNQHGHYVVTITGLGFTGAEEIKKLKSAGFEIGMHAQQVLLTDDYNKNHRLINGKYQVVFVPGKEVGGKRTTRALQAYAQKFGYGKPIAGVMPRVRESVPNEQMEKMGFRYIAVLHDSIKDSGGYPTVLHSHRDGGESWLSASYGYPAYEWFGGGAFAFFAPQGL